MKIKIMPFLSKKGARVAKAAIEFDDGPLSGFQLVGFTICEDREKKLYVLFPSAIVTRNEQQKPYFFLRPSAEGMLQRLQDEILDVYDTMVGFNRPTITKQVEASK